MGIQLDPAIRPAPQRPPRPHSRRIGDTLLIVRGSLALPSAHSRDTPSRNQRDTPTATLRHLREQRLIVCFRQKACKPLLIIHFQSMEIQSELVSLDPHHGRSDTKRSWLRWGPAPHMKPRPGLYWHRAGDMAPGCPHSENRAVAEEIPTT